MRDINLLHPKTKEKCEEIIKIAKSRGLDPILITDTLRTKAEQDAIYAQGRTTPGGIISYVKYPDGVHCWYHAFDFCKNIRGQEWNDLKFFEEVGKIGESLGMEWGGRWTQPVDRPHLQDKEFLMGKVNASALVAKWGTPEKYRATWDVKYKPEEVPAKPIPEFIVPKTLSIDKRVPRQKQAEVVQLQELLNKKGNFKLTVDGFFGNDTDAAVKKFQWNNGLVVDGIVGKNTWTALLT